MAAFEAAVSLGYRYLETDVHLTRDNVIIAFHDDRLDRVTDRKGRISEMDWAEIKKALINGQEPIPRLEDLLQTWPDVRFNIDPKSDAVVRPLLSEIERLGAAHRVCIGSFSGQRLKMIRAEAKNEICTSMSPWEVLKLKIGSAIGVPKPPCGLFVPCVQVPTRYWGIKIIDEAFVNFAHENNVQVHVWTINDETEMCRLLDLGVDGIMTDDTTLLKSVLKQRNLW